MLRLVASPSPPRSFALGLALACVLAAAATSARADEEWRPASSGQSILVERRHVPGCPYYEFRATTHTPIAPSRIWDALWADRATGRVSRHYRKKRVLLRDGDRDRVVWEQIRTPVVSDRDYVIEIRRSGDPASRFHLEYDLAPGKRPPPDPGVVRANAVRGYWDVQRGADGGSDVTYVNHTDPGGRIPAFLVHGTQENAARDVVLEILEWAAGH